MTYGDNVGCMKMYNAFEVRSCGVDGRMEHESSDVDAEVCRSGLYHASLHVHLNQTGGCDLVVKHPKRIEQKVLSILTNTNLKHQTNFNSR